MKKLRIEDAVGKELCHDMTAIIKGGEKGVKFHRGHIIKEEDLEEMRNMGKNHVFVFEENKDEVHEEDAALALKEQFMSEDFEATKVSEGKISLIAKKEGIFTINIEALNSINNVEDFSVVTIADKKPVKKGDVLVAFRIIPLVTAKENVVKAVNIAKLFYPVFKIIPYNELKCGLIVTGNEIFEGRIKDGFEPVIREKLKDFPGELEKVFICPDDEAEILKALKYMEENNIDLVFVTGGMSVDPDDITVNTIKKSGAVFLIRGVNIQPGNMLSLAVKDLEDKKQIILGVPGASMHAKITSLDVFLPRIFAKLPFSHNELQSFSVGGLLNSGLNHILNVYER